ncbi:MAG: acyltransferase [Oscillospiraceae bacterium]|nr:acyltransferase [Oscillospiraceae bacterium]
MVRNESSSIKGKRSSRDSRIEALRIACCLCVIALHCKPNSVVNGTPIFFRYLLSNLIADPVSIFLLITGFFFVNKDSYWDSVKKNLIRIFLPLLFYTIVVIIVSGGASSSAALKESLFSLGNCLITWTPNIHNTGHLWYLYVHLLIVLLSPLIKYLLVKIRSNRYIELLAIVFILALFWINDLHSNNMFRCTQIPVSSLLPASLLVILGNIVYDIVKKSVSCKRYLWLFIFLYIGLNLYRSDLLTRGNIQMSDATFSFMGVVCALSVAFFVLSLPSIEGRFVNIINWVSSFTLDIYIWHVIAMEMTTFTGLKTWFVSLITDGSETNSVYLRYTILYSLLVMVICIIWSLLLKLVKHLIYKFASYLTPR